MPDLIVLRHGELFLKGDNRRQFEQILEGNLRRTLSAIPEAWIERGQGRHFVHCPEGALPMVLERLGRVFGLSSLSPAVSVAPDLDAIGAAALTCVEQRLTGAGASGSAVRSFRIKARRADKSFPHPSPEIGRLVGARVVEATGLAVDLEHPELSVGVEVGPVRSFVFVERIPGAGGLPVGSSGKVLLLLSGGIDSPVAGHLMQKRGCRLDALYFHSPPYTGARTRAKVEQLATQLAPAQGDLSLLVVTFTSIQTAVRDRAPCEMAVILYRRAMMRIASALARARGCLALATGENLGQVASQTIENLGCIEASADLIVLRPLLAFDKAETIALARRIGSYDLSTEPYEDCCSLFVPRHPLIRARAEQVAQIEAQLSLDGLIEEAVGGAERVTLC
jgi:thiamine biosynthesis protein ThiI